MKQIYIDRIFTVIAVFALLFFIGWISKSCNHRTEQKEQIIIDSLQYWKLKAHEYEFETKFAKGKWREADSAYRSAPTPYQLDSFRTRFRENLRTGVTR